jgi:hypothetical protein
MPLDFWGDETLATAPVGHCFGAPLFFVQMGKQGLFRAIPAKPGRFHQGDMDQSPGTKTWGLYQSSPGPERTT